MLKVKDLIKHLNSLNPALHQARLAFYNYLQFFCTADEAFTPELIESFFFASLDYTHWQQNRGQLAQEVRQSLESLIRQTSTDYFDLNSIRWVDQMQVVEIESLNDWQDALQVYMKTQVPPEDPYRMIYDELSKKTLVLQFSASKGLTIHQFDRKFMINHGQLEPLRKDLILSYDTGLDLKPQAWQKMETAPFVTAHFYSSPNSVKTFTGVLTRGYLFQKFYELKDSPLEIYPKLFLSLKRIEQFFLKRDSDPFYNELQYSLERAIQDFRIGDVIDANQIMEVLARAQTALESVFLGDKLLELLIRDLQHTMSHRPTPQIRASVSVAKPIKSADREPTPIRFTHGDLDILEDPEKKKSWPQAPTTNQKRPPDLTN